jgi:hypothetical protein
VTPTQGREAGNAVAADESLIRVALAAAMAAGLGLAQAQEPIKIGAINPYSGPLAQYGDEATRGFELGVDLGPALPSDAPRLPEQSSAIKYNQKQSTAIKVNQG